MIFVFSRIDLLFCAQYQQGAAPIPKSVTRSRIKENIEIFDFNLTDEEMSSIESLAIGERVAAFSS